MLENRNHRIVEEILKKLPANPGEILESFIWPLFSYKSVVVGAHLLQRTDFSILGQ